MKALSVRQPWAWAIIEGHKRIVNRTWYPGDLSGDFAIHAPSVFEAETYTTLTLTFPEIDWPKPARFKYGGIIGLVSYGGSIHGGQSATADPWFTGPYGWMLSNPRRLPFIECKGALGLWDIDIQEMDIISELIARQNFKENY